MSELIASSSRMSRSSWCLSRQCHFELTIRVTLWRGLAFKSLNLVDHDVVQGLAVPHLGKELLDDAMGFTDIIQVLDMEDIDHCLEDITLHSR